VLSSLHFPDCGYLSVLLDGMIGHLGWLGLYFGLIHGVPPEWLLGVVNEEGILMVC
jgi:hypothetical protein